jgi:hypothetical protein
VRAAHHRCTPAAKQRLCCCLLPLKRDLSCCGGGDTAAASPQQRSAVDNCALRGQKHTRGCACACVLAFASLLSERGAARRQRRARGDTATLRTWVFCAGNARAALKHTTKTQVLRSVCVRVIAIKARRLGVARRRSVFFRGGGAKTRALASVYKSRSALDRSPLSS